MRQSLLLLCIVSSVSLPTSGQVLEPESVEAFVDGYMAAYLDEDNIAGAAVSVVEGSEIVFAKGYGYSNVEELAPVDPETTLFRIGSVSKLFVWTSVMQLVERGQLDLDADINEYLTDIEIPEAFGGPVTMAHLMTHTSGLDERVLGLFGDDEASLRPLGDILREELPDRVRPTDELSSYSNHGTGLAMFVVEEITGVAWDAYIDQNILEPLGMRSTTFQQPLPPELAPHMSKGYRATRSKHTEVPFEFVPLAPVGSAASTATDMARFAAAHLALGRYGELDEERILQEATARRMQSTLFNHHPDINGMAHGFMEMDWNGERVLGHGGDTEVFHTLFAFFPERDIAVFASFNTVRAKYMQFFKAFVDWRFPQRKHVLKKAEADELERFAGVYRPTRFPHDTFVRVAAVAGAFEVTVDDDHLVTMGSTPRHWYASGPLQFREKGKSATIVFRESADGDVTHFFMSDVPVVAFERAPTLEDPELVTVIAGGSFAVMAAALLFWPIAAMLRWHYGVSLTRDQRVPGSGRWAGWLAALVLVGFTISLVAIMSSPMKVVYGLTAGERAIFWLPILACAFAVLALFGAIRAWRSGRGSLLGRTAFTGLVVAIGLFLWQLQSWNLLGFHF